MNPIRPILFVLVAVSSSALAQIKGEMPFTSSSPNANQLIRKAWVVMSDANAEEGIKYLQQVLQEDPACAMAYLSFPTTSDEERAANIRKAGEMKMSADEKLFLEGAKASHDKKPVREYFDPLVKKYPRDNYLHLLIMFMSQQQEPAIEIGENLIKRNPKFAPAYNLLGYEYMAENDLAKAEAHFDKYVALRPDLANPYDSKADYMMRTGRIEDAIALYEKAAAMGMTPSATRAEDARGKLKFPDLSDNDKAGIKEMIASSIEAYEKGDADALLKDYSEHAIKIWGNQMATVGMAGVRQAIVNHLKSLGYKKFGGPIGFVGGVGPMAVASGTIVSVSNQPGAYSGLDRKQNVIYLFRKNSDGNWKILADHFYDAEGPDQRLSAHDRQRIQRLISNWNNSLPSGQAIEEKQIEDFGSSYSDQAIEIFGNQNSNIGLPNLRARWALFKGAIMETNSLGNVSIEGLGQRALAWGIGKQSFYPKDSKELRKSQFPWAMFLTKEDEEWKILVIHFGE